ncbi:MAG: RNA 2',3'-cyclic phosphodiesterase [Nitrospiraceae bacterium]|nr:RNA 2',3'-cyclic phosphodiesterase [Nitrospiraceae bacterium]
MVRTFLAIDLPDTQNKIIEGHKAQWRSIKTDARWIASTKMHLTLIFLGKIQKLSLGQVIATCRDVCYKDQPFSLALKGTGTFPGPERPRILWVGIGGETYHLHRLQRDLESALEKKGFPQEDRAFLPHLTVGRIRSPHRLSSTMDIFMRDEITSPLFLVNEIIVYESLLLPKGPIYKPLARCPLLGS